MPHTPNHSFRSTCLRRPLPALALGLLLLLPAPASAEIHPLDARLGRALDQAMNTQDMVEALTASYQAWDKELNRAYGAAMKRLDKAGQAALKKAQRAWVAYKEAQEKALPTLFSAGIGGGGTLDRVTAAEFVCGVVRSRAIALARIAGDDTDYGTPDDHPVDRWYEADARMTGSTAEMNGLNGEALDRWDKELNRAYAALMKRLAPAGAEALRTVQRAWLKFRDAWNDGFGAILAGGAGGGGSLDSVFGSATRMLTTRTRALELIALLSGEGPDDAVDGREVAPPRERSGGGDAGGSR